VRNLLVHNNTQEISNGDHIAQFEKGSHPDVYQVTREEDKKKGVLRKNITIKQIREAKQWASQSPMLKAGKYIIIEDVHLFSIGAYNSLLKLLEEPPHMTYLILLADSTHSILDTILSRVQTIFLPAMSHEDLLAIAGTRTSGDIINAGRGRAQWVQEMAQDNQLQEAYFEQCNELAAFIAAPLHERLMKITQWKAMSRDEMSQKLSFLLEIFRDIMLMKSGQANLVAHTCLRDWYYTAQQNYTVVQIGGIIDALTSLIDGAEFNAHVLLHLENLSLRF
jgi:DNA polymerase-3 subunit delta'